MILGNWSDKLLKPHTSRLVRDDAIIRWGGERLMRFSKAYNRLRYAGRQRQHRNAYTHHWEELLRGNNHGVLPPRRLNISDGWLRDDSRTLPHLDALLEQTAAIIRERGGRHHSDIQQPYLRSLLFPGDLERHPAFLDFILSSEILDIAARHLGTVPVLSRTRPPGVRFIDSSRGFHRGSRHAIVPRFQVMYTLTTPCRADLSLTFMPQWPTPAGADHTPLRRLVLAPWA